MNGPGQFDRASRPRAKALDSFRWDCIICSSRGQGKGCEWKGWLQSDCFDGERGGLDDWLGKRRVELRDGAK